MVCVCLFVCVCVRVRVRVRRRTGRRGAALRHPRPPRHQRRHAGLPCERQPGHPAGQHQWQVLRVHPEGGDQRQRGG